MMHLIPDTWSHFHMLVSVFPSVGLIFVMGYYIVSMGTNNESMKRISLLAIGVLALLAIPTYISGDGSASMLAEAPNAPTALADRIYYHSGWAYAALAVLALTGITAFLVLWRFPNGQRLSSNATHLVLGLCIATLALMAICGELGWEISHNELHLASSQIVTNNLPSGSDIAEGQSTPQAWSHVHMILNHFPTVGLVITLGFYLFALGMNNDVMKRACLAAFAICGILGAPTYVTGAAAMWALTQPPMAGVTHAAIDSHRDMALLTLFGLAFTGVTAWIELWRYRYLGRFSTNTLYMVLAFAVITLGVMAETGHRGGLINHPEIRTETMPTDPSIFWSPNIELLINNVIWFVPWQTVHFFGYSLVFGTVTAVVLRVFGFWKSMPFSAVHRLLPLGVFGVTINVFTGMLMLMADTFRYVNETTFIPKMALLPVGAIAVLYFSLSERLWNTKAGEEAPMLAKWVAALVLLSWIGVIMGGRLLPYL
jgi:uncharacterized membrane protein